MIHELEGKERYEISPRGRTKPRSSMLHIEATELHRFLLTPNGVEHVYPGSSMAARCVADF